MTMFSFEARGKFCSSTATASFSLNFVIDTCHTDCTGNQSMATVAATCISIQLLSENGVNYHDSHPLL